MLLPTMLTAAFIFVAIAVLLGAVLAVLHLREGVAMPPLSLGKLHGFIALAGLGCVILSLRGPPRGLDQGTASFGMIAAVLLTLAAALGLVMMALHRRGRRIAGALIGIHATLAVGGFVVLVAYVLAG